MHGYVEWLASIICYTQSLFRISMIQESHRYVTEHSLDKNHTRLKDMKV